MFEWVQKIVRSVWTPLTGFLLALVVFVMYLNENGWIPRASAHISVGVLLQSGASSEEFLSQVQSHCPSCQFQVFTEEPALEDESWKELKAWWVIARLTPLWKERLAWVLQQESAWVFAFMSSSFPREMGFFDRAIRIGEGDVDIRLPEGVSFEVAAAQITEPARPYLRMTLPMLREWVRAGSQGPADDRSFGVYQSEWWKAGRPGVGTYRFIPGEQKVALNLREPIEEVRLDAECDSGKVQESFFVTNSAYRYDVSLKSVWGCRRIEAHLRKPSDPIYFKTVQIEGVES